MPATPTVRRPTLLFGAFDRHNFGDLLFPHIAAALLPGCTLRFAGLASRDLRPWGGHRVEALRVLAARFAGQPVNLLQVGGELLCCSAWEAALMLQPAAQLQATLARLDGRPEAQRAWARERLGLADQAPYLASRALFPAARLLGNALGGMDLDRREAGLRAEVLDKLRGVDALSVRDRRTQALLAAAGIAAPLCPDPAALVAELFARRIALRAGRGETAEILRAFPGGYLALQCSGEFADDASLNALAAQLDPLARRHGLGLLLFRAGAAPWHDDLSLYRRLAARLRSPTRIAGTLDIWDICALIARSRGYLGSSLHGRIVAMAFAVPRLSLHSGTAPGKAGCYAASWEAPGLPTSVAVTQIADSLPAALAADPAQLQRSARQLAARYRQGFAALCAALA